MARASSWLAAAAALVAWAAPAGAQQEIRVQCPPGMVAVIRGSTVTCEPAAAPPPPARPPPQPAPAQPDPTPPPSRVHTVVIQKDRVVGNEKPSLELKGLYAIPDLCGLYAGQGTVENTKEAIYLAMLACMEDLEIRAPTEPARWVPFKVEAVSERRHIIIAPPEPWASPLQQCLTARPPRLPRATRSKTFTAWYLLASDPQHLPTQHPCGHSQ